MKFFSCLFFLQLFCLDLKSQNTDTIIAIIPRHFEFSFFEKKINPDDFFVSNDTLYYKSYQKWKIKKSDTVVYYSNFILNKPIIFKRIQGNKVFIGYWNYESVYGKFKYFHKNGLCMIEGEINRNQSQQNSGRWLYYDKTGKLKK
jgi:hypothetical protein